MISSKDLMAALYEPGPMRAGSCWEEDHVSDLRHASQLYV